MALSPVMVVLGAGASGGNPTRSSCQGPVPKAGSPLRATLPVDKPQVGWVIVPIRGAEGVAGWGLITAGN